MSDRWSDNVDLGQMLSMVGQFIKYGDGDTSFEDARKVHADVKVREAAVAFAIAISDELTERKNQCSDSEEGKGSGSSK